MHKKIAYLLTSVLILSAMTGCTASDSSSPTVADDTAVSVYEETTSEAKTEATSAETKKETEPVQTTKKTETTIRETAGNVSVSQENALIRAKSYLATMSFSREGLIGQLEFEGYSNSDATYAADNCGADWNKQAVLKAKEYLSTMSFSYDGLVEQLEFEGFTH